MISGWAVRFDWGLPLKLGCGLISVWCFRDVVWLWVACLCGLGLGLRLTFGFCDFVGLRCCLWFGVGCRLVLFAGWV